MFGLFFFDKPTHPSAHCKITIISPKCAHIRKWNTCFSACVIPPAAVRYRRGWENHPRGVYRSAALGSGCVRSEHGQALQGDRCRRLWFHHLLWVDSSSRRSNARLHFQPFAFSSGVSSCSCLFLVQVNFKPLPPPTRNTPSSSPRTWSFRDIKRSRRRRRAIWNWPVGAVRGINRKTAPLTKKTTEREDDRELSHRETEHWNHCTEREKLPTKSVTCPPTTFFFFLSKFQSFATAEPYCRLCACLFYWWF